LATVPATVESAIPEGEHVRAPGGFGNTTGSGTASTVHADKTAIRHANSNRFKYEINWYLLADSVAGVPNDFDGSTYLATI